MNRASARLTILVLPLFRKRAGDNEGLQRSRTATSVHISRQIFQPPSG